VGDGAGTGVGVATGVGALVGTGATVSATGAAVVEGAELDWARVGVAGGVPWQPTSTMAKTITSATPWRLRRPLSMRPMFTWSPTTSQPGCVGFRVNRFQDPISSGIRFSGKDGLPLMPARLTGPGGKPSSEN
jgi:hypothetical protein